jgi:hypothetical protein
MADQKPTQPKGYTPPPGATPLHGAQSETFKWEDHGTVLEGIYIGLEDGSMGGKILILQTSKGKERASAPTQLVRALDGIKQGTKLAIQYDGEVKAKSGRMVKQFKVWAL